MVATDPAVSPTGYGLGRHGWIAFSVDDDAGEERWRQIEEWVRTSYTLVAPKRLAKLVVARPLMAILPSGVRPMNVCWTVLRAVTPPSAGRSAAGRGRR